MYCVCCGEWTNRRGPFGEALCEPCHKDEDDLIETVERREAKKHGYAYGWKEDQN